MHNIYDFIIFGLIVVGVACTQGCKPDATNHIFTKEDLVTAACDQIEACTPDAYDSREDCEADMTFAVDQTYQAYADNYEGGTDCADAWMGTATCFAEHQMDACLDGTETTDDALNAQCKSYLDHAYDTCGIPREE